MNSRISATVLIAATFLANAPAFPQGTAAADNSKSNKIDPSARAATADDQKNDKQDLLLAQQIRKSVIADKSLSTYAHNVKIVAVGGNVTLSGVVRTQAEKEAVGTKAQAIVKQGSLTNNLKIAP